MPAPIFELEEQDTQQGEKTTLQEAERINFGEVMKKALLREREKQVQLEKQMRQKIGFLDYASKIGYLELETPMTLEAQEAQRAAAQITNAVQDSKEWLLALIGVLVRTHPQALKHRNGTVRLAVELDKRTQREMEAHTPRVEVEKWFDVSRLATQFGITLRP